MARPWIRCAARRPGSGGTGAGHGSRPVVEPAVRAVPAPAPARPSCRCAPEPALGTAAVLGMGYVGLPTSLALAGAGFNVIGVDVSERRLEAIRAGAADMLPRDRMRLERVTGSPRLRADHRRRRAGRRRHGLHLRADAGRRGPAARPARTCAPPATTVVAQARAGQLILLTSTTYVGTTTRPADPAAAGPRAGRRARTSSSRSRPSASTRATRPTAQEDVPRVVGGATEDCAEPRGRRRRRDRRPRSPGLLAGGGRAVASSTRTLSAP